MCDLEYEIFITYLMDDLESYQVILSDINEILIFLYYSLKLKYSLKFINEMNATFFLICDNNFVINNFK